MDNLSIEAKEALSKVNQQVLSDLLISAKAFYDYFENTYRPVLVQVLQNINPERDWEAITISEWLDYAKQAGGFDNLITFLGIMTVIQKALA